MQLSQASSQAANEAAALFFDDEPKPQISQPPVNELDDLFSEPESLESTSNPTASGIELPEQVNLPKDEGKQDEVEQTSQEEQSEVNLLKGTCTNCSLQFQVPMPVGVKEAIVICPSCSSEQLFQR